MLWSWRARKKHTHTKTRIHIKLREQYNKPNTTNKMTTKQIFVIGQLVELIFLLPYVSVGVASHFAVQHVTLCGIYDSQPAVI